ncbi:ABC transporter permease subunit [Frankia sp. R82]|uniref:ABC transporter permease subunit n=1 Tax=Frankia sp. R82 TaxID=2950553 RepID=UPI0020447BC3|nr:ABC transporter permease subunit [Frankia sp. R82]MCM3886862.1 DUF1349 domain-containing protein [Frankia sp. R82]
MTAFARTLRAEWTKFRTVRGWVLASVATAALIVAFGLVPGMRGSCGKTGPGSECRLPVGPGGQEVSDSYTYFHQPLSGDGTITVRVGALTGLLPGDDPNQPRHGLAPWTKAGLLLRAGTVQGSSYAAVTTTGAHGTRLQYDYTHDLAGQPGGPGQPDTSDAAGGSSGTGSAGPRWLRLARTGDTIRGAESPDGVRWTMIGSARLPGLATTVQVGLFVTSPQYSGEVHRGLASGAFGGPSQATGTFDHLAIAGGWTGTAWQPDVVGGERDAVGDQLDGPATGAESVERVGDIVRLTGSGDIAPAVVGAAGLGVSLSQTLVGTFVGLIVAVVVGCVFGTAEYRRGLVRTTLLASPGRTRVLAAKAAVVGTVMFGAGLAAAAVVVVLGQRVLRGNGVYVHPTPTLTEVRIVAGTAALLALAAVLALGLGTLLRRGVTAVTLAIVLVVLPYLLAVTVLPAGPARWLLRVSPASAFALQQATPEYPQVANLYTPVNGYFPLAPWAGLAVLVSWVAVALAVAALALHRRDA